jgi:hypothetical protein
MPEIKSDGETRLGTFLAGRIDRGIVAPEPSALGHFRTVVSAKQVEQAIGGDFSPTHGSHPTSASELGVLISHRGRR